MSTADARQRLAALHAIEEPEHAARVIAALEDESPVVREHAIRYAARYLEPARLVRMVGNDERALLRNSAIAALERQGPYAVRPLEQVLAGPVDPELAMFTLQVLARIGDESSTSAALPFVRHDNANVAQAAIEALGCFRATDAVPDLLAIMGGNLWLQLAAVNALGAIGDARAAGPLLALAPDSLLAIPALQALGKLPADAVAEPLARLLCDVREPASREAALAALAEVIARDPADGALARGLSLVANAASEPTLMRMLQGAMGDPRPEAQRLSVAAAMVSLAAPVSRAWCAALLVAARHEPESTRRLLCVPGARLASLVESQLGGSGPAVRAALLELASTEIVTLPRLLQALQDTHPLVRAAAGRTLATRRAPEAVALLVEMLRNGSEEERSAAAMALAAQSARELDALSSCLAPAVEPELLVHALGVLERAGGQPHADRVFDLVGHPSPSVRRAALRVVAGLVDRRTEPSLLKALADVDAEVPAEALELLVQRGGSRIVDSLIALLSLEDSLRFRVIRALGRLRCAGASAKLEALYPGCPLHEQLEVIGALVQIAPPGLRDFLCVQLAGTNLELRRAAARGLATVADPGDLPLLQQLAADRDWNVRNEAARGLARLPLDGSKAILLTLARDIEPVVAVTARAAFRDGPARARPVPA